MKLNLREINRCIPIAKRIVKERLLRCIIFIFEDKTIKKNVWGGEKYKKRVLLPGAIMSAFDSNHGGVYHTAPMETRVIAQVFDELGYVVDCCVPTKRNVDLSKYDVVFGGRDLMQDIWKKNIKIKSIYYSPGAHPYFCVNETIKRLRTLKKEKGLWFTDSMRYMQMTAAGLYADYLSDYTIVVGNNYVLSHFLKHDNINNRYSVIPLFYHDCQKPDLEKKNFTKAKKGICWLGGMGLVHKGLDICIDIALNHPDIVLHICGATKREKEFWKYYSPLIKGKDNIIDHGFVELSSTQFVDIMNQCAFMVNPSISEGGAGAVLNVVANGGLIPIYSKATGLDLENNGIMVPEVDFNLFENAVVDAMKLPDEEIKKRSILLCKEVRENYSLQLFHDNIKKIVCEVLNS